MQITEVREWLTSESAQQSKLASHQKPVLLSTSIDSRLETLRKPFNTLKNRKKPKPPPAPKKPQNATNVAEEKDENRIRQEEDRENIILDGNHFLS